MITVSVVVVFPVQVILVIVVAIFGAQTVRAVASGNSRFRRA